MASSTHSRPASIFKDARQYWRSTTRPTCCAPQFSQVIPPGIYRAKKATLWRPQGWYGEETLDVEAVHAMAPGADIVYAGGGSCSDHDIDVALNNLVDGSLVNMVSNSYGDLGEDIDPGTKAEFDQIATQAASQGIGLYFSSGDAGDDSAVLSQPETDSRPTRIT